MPPKFCSFQDSWWLNLQITKWSSVQYWVKGTICVWWNEKDRGWKPQKTSDRETSDRFKLGTHNPPQIRRPAHHYTTMFDTFKLMQFNAMSEVSTAKSFTSSRYAILLSYMIPLIKCILKHKLMLCNAMKHAHTVCAFARVRVCVCVFFHSFVFLQQCSREHCHLLRS
jgi:hypothetical protein